METAIEKKARLKAEQDLIIQTGKDLITKGEHSDDDKKVIVNSMFEITNDRPVYTEQILSLGYLPSKAFPDDANKGTYLVQVVSNPGVTAFTLPVGVVHAIARTARVLAALRSIVGSTVEVQFMKVGEALRDGTIVDKDNYFTSGVRITFSDYINQKAAELDLGIASANNSGIVVDRTNAVGLPPRV